MKRENAKTGADPRIDATRAELERTATVQQAAQEHHDSLTTRLAAAEEAVREAKRARKTAKAEMVRSEKAVSAESASAKSLAQQVKVAAKLVVKTHGDVEAAERRHNDLLTKQAKRQEKEAASAARQEAEQARAEARRARHQALREAEDRARTEERRVREEAEQRAADQVEKAEQEAEKSRQTAAKQVAALTGSDSTQQGNSRRGPAPRKATAGARSAGRAAQVTTARAHSTGSRTSS